MSLNNSINNYCFSAIFDSSDDPFENYADKKTCTKKKHFGWSLEPVRQCTNYKKDTKFTTLHKIPQRVAQQSAQRVAH